jgi:hypothetical protein
LKQLLLRRLIRYFAPRSRELTLRLCSPLISTTLHDDVCYRNLGAEYIARRNPPKRANRIHNLRQSQRFALSR